MSTVDVTFENLFECLKEENEIVPLSESENFQYMGFVWTGLAKDAIKGFISPAGIKYILIGEGKGEKPAVYIYTKENEIFENGEIITPEQFKEIFEVKEIVQEEIIKQDIIKQENVQKEKKKLSVAEWCGILTTGVILVLGAVVIKDRYF